MGLAILPTCLVHGFQVDENGAYTFEDGSAAHERPQIRLTYDESTGDFHQ